MNDNMIYFLAYLGSVVVCLLFGYWARWKELRLLRDFIFPLEGWMLIFNDCKTEEEKHYKLFPNLTMYFPLFNTVLATSFVVLIAIAIAMMIGKAVFSHILLPFITLVEKIMTIDVRAKFSGGTAEENTKKPVPQQPTPTQKGVITREDMSSVGGNTVCQTSSTTNPILFNLLKI